jgi:AcrR family transcriptional regulator
MTSKPQTAQRERTGAALLRQGVTRSINRAVLIELAKSGYARLSLQAVAKRAGVGKAAIYRRWKNKEDLIIDLLSEVSAKLVTVEDTGSLKTDIDVFLRRSVEILRRPLARRILPDLYTEMTRNSSLAEALRSNIQVPKRDRGRVILRRAIERGEVPASIDMELAFDLLAGPLYWRLVVTQEPATERYIRKLTNALVAAFKEAGGLQSI